MKFIVDLWLDGCENEEDMKKACIQFIEESLDFSGSSVRSVEVYEQYSVAKQYEPCQFCGSLHYHLDESGGVVPN